MAASINIHSWSPHADNSALFLVTSSFAKLALYLLVRPAVTLLIISNKYLLISAVIDFD